MDRKTQWITRLFFLLFTVSVSVAVLPGGIVNVHGLFGEVTACVIVEDEDHAEEQIRDKYYEAIQKVKGINIINIWFEVLLVAVCICFWANIKSLPRGDTIITLKVRMDN